MLTKADLIAISDLIRVKTESLPTRDEFFNKMDEVIGELKNNREEQTLQGGRISEHTDLLETHEQHIADLEKTLIP